MMQKKNEPMPKANEIWYEAEEKVTLYTTTLVTDHTFSDGKGVVKFDRNLTAIQYAWFRNTAVTSVTLPSGITSIGSYAFNGCSSLALIELPSGITSIGDDTFYGCTSLALTELPSGITSIGSYAFRNCTSLALTELPSGITRIGDYAFYGISSILSLTIPIATPPTIGNSVFSGTYPIYVPAEAVETYKATTRWSSLASRIFAIEE